MRSTARMRPRFLSRRCTMLPSGNLPVWETFRVADPVRGRLAEKTGRTCHRAVRLEDRGETARAEALLRAAVRRSTAAVDAPTRRVACAALARFLLRRNRAAEAAVWQQQSVAAWCEGGCLGPPDLALADAVEAALRATAVGGGQALLTVGSGRLCCDEVLSIARRHAELRCWAAAAAWVELARAVARGSRRSRANRIGRWIAVLAALDGREG